MSDKQHRVPRHVLTIKQRLFVEAYLANGQNARQAYLKLHPKSQPQTADVHASRLLSLDKVRGEVERRLRYSLGITRQQIEADLLWSRDAAIKAGDYDSAASIAMDCAKLAGFLVEKREDVTPKTVVDRKEILEELRNRGLVPSN